MKTLLLNIGLMGNTNADEDTISVFDVISQLKDHGFATKHHAIAQSETEPTAVVLVTHNHPTDDARDLAAYSVAQALRQDCIAVLPLDGTPGFLEGPNAAAWGRFDAKYFIGL